MNSYVSELFARERAADFRLEADRDALAQLAERTKPPALSRVRPGRHQILAAVEAAIRGIGQRGKPADRPPQRRSAV